MMVGLLSTSQNNTSCMYITTLTVLCPQYGWTALLAAQEGKVDVVRLLIDVEAQVNIQSEVHTL